MCEDLLSQHAPAAPCTPSGDTAIVVLDDQHLLGARIVRSVLASAGYGLVDYGPMTAAEAATRIRDEKPSIVLVSTLMLRSALQVGPLVESLQRAGLSTRVIVGGAPFRLDDKLWKQVGAHAMGRTASDALELVKQLPQVAA
jgi:methanogenic corrinoid protein MtbC1